MDKIEQMIRQEHDEFFSQMEEKKKTAKSDVSKRMIEALEQRFISDVREELLQLIEGEVK